MLKGKEDSDWRLDLIWDDWCSKLGKQKHGDNKNVAMNKKWFIYLSWVLKEHLGP
jgi:hypothetical protein